MNDIKDNSRNILIITYYWPPSGGVGVQRWMNFALQLKQRGWNPIVLTPENPQFEIKDEQLVSRVSEIEVVKVPIWEPFQLFHALTGQKNKGKVQQGLALEKDQQRLKDRLIVWVRGNLMIPDPRVFWVKRAAKEAINRVKLHNIATIITTGPPHSMHLVGHAVKKKTGVKWLADFRDPWSKWDVLDKLKTTPLVRKLHRRLEARVIAAANRVTTVSPRLAQALGGVEVIYNGLTIGKSDRPSQNTDDKYFTIGYFGLLNEMRNPTQLWQVLDRMCGENENFASRLQVKIGGIVSGSIQAEIQALKNLRPHVHFLGYLPHEEMQQQYSRCDLLLLLLNKTDNARWILPVKFFEYLASSQPILALGSEDSDLADLMRGKQIGEIFPYESMEEMKAFITGVLDETYAYNNSDAKELLQSFSHESLVVELENLLTWK